MKKIKLKSNGLGRYDDVSPFMVTDNKLELKIELPNFNGEFYLVAENNGKFFKKLLLPGERVMLDKLTAGELQAEVKHYFKGELIKTYKVEPLILKEVEGSLSGTPEITALRVSIAELANSFDKYKEGAGKCFEEYKKASEEREAKLEKNLLALMRFAIKDYENNVYLDGGSVEKFICEFGLELTEEEINSIKGEENDVEEN